MMKLSPLCQTTGDRAEEALLNDNVATNYLYSYLYKQTDTLSEARTYMEKSVQLHHTMGSQRAQAQALWGLSRIDYYAEQYDSAEEYCLQALQLVDKIEDVFGKIYVQEHLGQILLANGDKDGAVEVWEDALAIAEHLQHPWLDKLKENIETAYD